MQVHCITLRWQWKRSNKVAAIISGLCFLAVEPEGKRAKSIYEYIFELFNTFAKKDGEKNTTITLIYG